MRKPPRHHSSPRTAVPRLPLIGALLATGLTPALAQRSEAPGPERRAVAVFTYHRAGGRLQPSRSFSGLLAGRGHVITSSRALGQGHANPFAGTNGAAPAAEIVIALSTGIETLVTPCRVLNDRAAGQGPLALLELPEHFREKLAQVELPPLQPVALESGRGRQVVGVIAPEGHLPDALEAESVPQAVSLPVRLEAPSTLVTARVAAAAVRQTLPRQMAGAGVWTSDGALMGVMVRHQDHWRVVDARAMVKQVERLLPPPAPAARVVLKPPAAPRGPEGQPYRPAGRPPLPRLLQLVSELGLQLKLQPGLLDEVGQEQADMVMAMIGGRSFGDAIEMLVDIEPLVDGLLAEQLNYRHALALVLTGNYAKALPRAKAASEADDPLVKARGQLLFDVLSQYPDGRFKGQALKSDTVLVAAIMARMDQVQKKLFADLASVHADQPLDAEIFAAVHAKLDAVLADIDGWQRAWPGYFKRARIVLEQHRTALYQAEYLRTTGELKVAHRAYLQSKGATDFVSGPEWSTPGHWPAQETEEANRQVERFNQLLQHYYMVESSVPAAQRSPLPAALARSLEPLRVAVPRAG